jgi:UDP-N-acetylglucosamine--N-acetylmuramyl-(pentapeptide) pyrophosphoryl-undecaprenol N-acetylglucosamine transferase
MRRVLFAGGGTGGHLYPALALARAMQDLAPDIEVHFVGARRGVEARVLPQRGVPHTLLPIEPFHRRQLLRNWRVPPSIVMSTFGIAAVFRRFRPDLVVGTGGYASAPAGLFAAASRIPLALQEQNSYPGAVTRMLASRARQIHLGFPEAERHLGAGKTTRIFSHGNPIRPPDTSLDRRECRTKFGLSTDATVLLVVGGSQGSRALNNRLLGALARVARGGGTKPEGFEILWATGPAQEDAVRTHLGELGRPEWVKPFPYIDDMPAALAAADFALSRAGAMATAELLAWGLPMLLVPLPTAAADHQMHNARALEAAGAAFVLEEAKLTPDALWTAIVNLAGDTTTREAMARAAKARSNVHAAEKIAHELLTLVGDK